MAKNAKLHITVYQNGQFKGYIKSVSYSQGRFTLTQDIKDAKGYVTLNNVQGEIDFLTSISYAYGYIFGYN